MNKKSVDIFNVDTLAQKSGVSRRTIHYYSQRGLLMPPEGDGRGSHYTGKHLERLRELQKLAAQGLPLAKIKEYFDGSISLSIPTAPIMAESPAISQSTWSRIRIIEGLELHVQDGIVSDSIRQRILKAIDSALNTQTTDPKGE